MGRKNGNKERKEGGRKSRQKEEDRHARRQDCLKGMESAKFPPA